MKRVIFSIAACFSMLAILLVSMTANAGATTPASATMTAGSKTDSVVISTTKAVSTTVSVTTPVSTTVAVTTTSPVSTTVAVTTTVPVSKKPLNCDDGLIKSSNISYDGNIASADITDGRDIGCQTVDIGLAAYAWTDDTIDHQRPDGKDLKSISPQSSPVHLRVGFGYNSCDHQLDTFRGAYLSSLDGKRYGERLLKSVDHSSKGTMCNTTHTPNPSPTPTTPPATTSAPTTASPTITPTTGTPSPSVSVSPSPSVPVSTTVPASTTPVTPKPTTPVTQPPTNTTPATTKPVETTVGCVEKAITIDNHPSNRSYDGKSDSFKLTSGGPVSYKIHIVNVVNNSNLVDDKTGNLKDGEELTIGYPPLDQWLTLSDGSKEIYITVSLVGECQNEFIDWRIVYVPPFVHTPEATTPATEITCVPYGDVKPYYNSKTNEIWIEVSNALTVVDADVYYKDNSHKEVKGDFSPGQYKLFSLEEVSSYKIHYISTCGTVTEVKGYPETPPGGRTPQAPEVVKTPSSEISSTPVASSTSNIPKEMPGTGQGDKTQNDQPINWGLTIVLVIVAVLAGTFLIRTKRRSK